MLDYTITSASSSAFASWIANPALIFSIYSTPMLIFSTGARFTSWPDDTKRIVDRLYSVGS